MFMQLEEIAPHLLGLFMIGLACIPLIFVWQDRHRRLPERERQEKLPKIRPAEGRPTLAGR